jgi:hypothetical protein
MSEKRDKKCWRYSRNPDDKNDKNWYIFAFNNGKGACALDQFEAASGRHLKKSYRKGDFQDNFADWLNPISFPLCISLSWAITLVKARKEGLPAKALSEIKKQVIELAMSSLLSLLDC